ncbi:hypothetical protein F0U60_15670 [Archangium minus]|uniref:Cytochrome c domain-containing protein n=1 Tax=Archangium minus TaxID=83450 RepID=A0ABY9WP13_9BACT|nr:hypothetical protein F0U60_15670 [Archangium minus]
MALATSAGSPPAPLADSPASSLGVTLPIEVIGENGTERSITLPLTEQDRQSVLKLWLQVHSLSYENKASIRFNNGAWIDLNNSTAFVEGLGRNYGGIGGAFATLPLRIDVPAGALVAGNNILHFKFNQSDGRSIGFRVLKLNFIRPDGSRVFADGQFTQEDPNTWQPPISTENAIAEGELLWRSGALIQSQKNPVSIHAHCMDCHTQDGRDLKYFNYSNHAIIERSKFHGLTAEQGMKIASYIRTLSGVPNPGRPWNPPYQPGPRVGLQPVEHWAAGAGIEQVLEKDRDILPHIFPRFPNIQQGDVLTTGSLNTRTTPIPLQLPDWNHWLPTIHPKDAWGSDFTHSDAYKCYNGENGGCSTMGPDYKSMRARAALVKDSAYTNYFENLHYQSQSWKRALYEFLCPRYPSAQRCYKFPEGKERIPDELIGHDEAYAQKLYSTTLWAMVKTWEIMQEFGLEGHQKQLYKSSREDWGWMINYSFDTSPNMLQLHRDRTGINNNSPLMFVYFSAAWYQLAFTLYNGNHSDGMYRDGQRPIDWPYAYAFIAELQNSPTPNVPLNGLLTLWLLKAMQVADNTIGPDSRVSGYHNPSPGWAPRTVADLSKLVAPGFMKGWSDITEEERQDILEAMLYAWWTKSNDYDKTVWWKDSEVASTTEVINGNYEGSVGNKLWYVLSHFKHHGVSPGLVNSVATWAQGIWPQRDWSEVTRASCRPQLHYYICDTESFR